VDLGKRARNAHRYGTLELFPSGERAVPENEDHPEADRSNFSLEKDERKILDIAAAG
jgi:hypothetical protein